MLFIPTSSQAVADELSGQLWSLSRTPQARTNEVTSRLFGTRTDANGKVWLEVITDYAIPDHAEAVLDGIAPILAGAGLGEADIADLEALVISLRGQFITPWQFFPQVFKDAAKLEHEITWPARS